jgi:uncharacterized membrane protein YphA (DoxX/SURF4 family)
MIFPELAEQSEWGLLALRVAVGAIFIVHGWPKITGPEGWPRGWAAVKRSR